MMYSAPAPLGPSKLVSGEAEQVHPQFADVDLYRSYRLDRVGVQVDLSAKAPGFAPEGGRYLGERLDGSYLVVGKHDADQYSSIRNGGSHIAGVHQAIFVH